MIFHRVKPGNKPNEDFFFANPPFLPYMGTAAGIEAKVLNIDAFLDHHHFCRWETLPYMVLEPGFGITYDAVGKTG